MRQWKRRSAAVATAAALVVAQVLVGSPPAQAADPVTLDLLTINDFHGRIDTNTVKFAGTVQGLRQADGADGANTLLVGAGDFIGASLFASAVQRDQPTIDVMNELGLNVSAVGNHEFDQGFADLVNRVIANKTNARWDYLGANVYDIATGQPALPEYGVYTVDGVRVGVIGVVTQETPTLVSPGGVSSLTFGDPVDAINRVADQLTDGNDANGEADVLVATLHEGAPQSAPATLESQLAASPVFSKIVTQTSPKVAAIVTGHTHQAYTYQAPVPGDPSRTRPIVQTGSYGANVGQITLTVDPGTHAVMSSTVRNVPRVTTDDATLIAQYPTVLGPINTTVQAALANAAAVGNTPVGSITASITTATTDGPDTSSVCGTAGKVRDDRASESTLGNLVANALRESLRADDRGGAEIGVVNPGGLRAELCYPADTMTNPDDKDGSVSYAEANSVLPFVNNLWTTTLTGAQFKTALEQQWQRDANGNIPTRPYLQLGVSDNVTYTYDPNAAEGSHITSVTIDGAPLDPAKEYRIGSFSFLLQGGDNFRIFTDGANTKDSGLVDRDAWIAYLQAHQDPPLSPDFARHAVAVTGQPSTVAAGAAVAFDVSKLDLTSLGSPANTTLSATLRPVGSGVDVPVGSFPVAGGAAHVAFTVPGPIQAGSWNLVLTAGPSRTTVTIPLSVTATSSVSLSASASSQVYGSPNTVTLTARVTTSQPAGGSVEFRNGATVLGTADVVNGTATFRLPANTPAGRYSIVAHYTGDGAVPPADSAAVQVTVTQAGSVTALVGIRLGPLPPLLIGGTVLNNGQKARGTLEIRDNDTLIGTAPLRGAGLGLFQVPRSAWTTGSHRYVATFVPDDPANIAGSVSNPVTIRR